MILNQLIHRLNFCELCLEFLPIRLQHILGRKSQHLLYPLKHLSSEIIDSALPPFDIWSFEFPAPHRLAVFHPHRGKKRFEVLEHEKKTEHQLISSDGFSRNHQRERKLDVKVE